MSRIHACGIHTADIMVGTGDFMAAVKSGFYVDKTEFALLLLKHHRAALVRPPRMGKTLFISMVTALYDSAYAKVFPQLFKDLYVAGEDAAAHKSHFNHFYVLRICLPGSGNRNNFSQAATENLRASLTDFYRRHPDTAHFMQQQQAPRDAGVMWELQVLAGHLKDRLMVLVDEIDRAVMGDGSASGNGNGGSSSSSSSGGGGDSRSGGGGGGNDSGGGEAAAAKVSSGTPLEWVRDFLSLLKQVGDMYRVRYYVTGIFPVQTTTSIFNTKDDLTHSPCMAQAFGLTAADVEQALEKNARLDAADRQKTLEHIRRDANGLHFFNSKEPLFNPQLVQVALRQLLDRGQLASTVVDNNQLLTQSQLTTMLRSTETAAKLLSGASFRGEISTTVTPEVTMNPATLLFYLGVASPHEPVEDHDGALVANLRIPNRATRWQFVDEFIKRTQGQLGSARRFLETPSDDTLREFLRQATSMRWTSRQTEDDLKALFFAEILHFTSYSPAAEHAYGGGRTDVSAQVRGTLIIVELKTVGAIRERQSLLKRTSDSFGFEWNKKQEEVEYSKHAREKMDEKAPAQEDLLRLEVTYSNSGKTYSTVKAVHESAIAQAVRYKQQAIALQRFHTVVAFAVTQVVHRFVSCEVGDSGGGGGGGGGAAAAVVEL